MDQGEFFDKNAEMYGSLESDKYDHFFIDFMLKCAEKCSMLDIGGGGGSFTKVCKEHFQETNLCIVDPSESLLHKQEFDGVELVIGKLPNEINIQQKFNYIHIRDVLHHITGSSIADTKKLLKESLTTSGNYLNKNGYLLIHEHYYESYLIPTLTRTFIFYILKLQNLLKIKVPAKEFILGLDVCFYTRNEIRKIITDLGFNIVDYFEEDFGYHKYKKLMLIKKWGRMCFVIQPQTSREN